MKSFAKVGLTLTLPLLIGLPALNVGAVESTVSQREAAIKLTKTRSCVGCDLRNVILSNTDLRDVDLTGSDLRGADLHRSNLAGATLERARLSKANLSYADLSTAHLEDADLTNANLQYASLYGAICDRANLAGAHLGGTNLQYVRFYKANLLNTKITVETKSDDTTDTSGAVMPDGSVYPENQ